MAKKKGLSLDVRIEELSEKYPIMRKLEDNSVVRAWYNCGDVLLTECRDNFFSVNISSEDAIQLSEFFAELADYMRKEEEK